MNHDESSEPAPAVNYYRLPTVEVHPVTKAELEQLRAPDGSSWAANIASFCLGGGLAGFITWLSVSTPDPITKKYVALLMVTLVLWVLGVPALGFAIFLPRKKLKLLDEIAARVAPLGTGAQLPSRVTGPDSSSSSTRES